MVDDLKVLVRKFTCEIRINYVGNFRIFLEFAKKNIFFCKNWEVILII